MSRKKTGRRTTTPALTELPTSTTPSDPNPDPVNLAQAEVPTLTEATPTINPLAHNRITQADVRLGKQKLTRPKFTHRRLARSR